jgi:hypothetical protein
MKCIKNATKTWVYIDKSTIYFNMLVYLVLSRSLGKIEKSFSPKLTDYSIQGVRNIVLLTELTLLIFFFTKTNV